MSLVLRSFLQPCKANAVPLNELVRHASKKASGSTSNNSCKTRPKHRGWRVQDGHEVKVGEILATQRRTRFHSGLHVGFGKDGTLFAMEPGRVMITCEKFDPNWAHRWVRLNYTGREKATIYKKYFSVIPEPLHNRFKLIDEI